MRLIQPSSADEMVASFLRAEIDSDVWGAGNVVPRLAAHGWPETLVRQPDLTDPQANRDRAQLLGEYRGWQTGTYLFGGFPADVVWHQAEMDRAEVAEVLGARFPTWLELSGVSRRVADSASATVVGPILNRDAANMARRANLVARRYREGELLEPPIVVATMSANAIVAVEGHTRLVAWAVAERPEPLRVILGLSDRISEWSFY